MLALMLLTGCAEVNLTPDTLPCTNWDLSVRDAPELSAAQDGDAMVVTRNGIFEDCDAQFDPDFQNERKLLRVFESWLGSEGNECQCHMAQLRVNPAARGTWEIQWYDESSDSEPVDVIEFDVD
ncbi:MAG: hypothetical protein H6740_27760 [Alphaproteobacteria bacterium]|nr:hypothetical protein [Alphaproteobacteria bacterium]